MPLMTGPEWRPVAGGACQQVRRYRWAASQEGGWALGRPGTALSDAALRDAALRGAMLRGAMLR